MALPGEKAKLVNFMDAARADSMTTLYTIDVVFEVSRRLKRPCGAIVVFKLNEVNLDPLKAAELSAGEMQEIQDDLHKQTEVMYREPIYFHEDQEKCKHHPGGMIGWAIDRALKLFDEYGTNADMSVKSDGLKVTHKLTRKQVMEGRENPRKLFKTAWDIQKLQKMGFRYDVWSQDIHRGATMLERLMPRKEK